MKAGLPEGSHQAPLLKAWGSADGGPSFLTEGPDLKYLHHNKSLENKELLSMEIRCFG